MPVRSAVLCPREVAVDGRSRGVGAGPGGLQRRLARNGTSQERRGATNTRRVTSR
jgi:hypothetical protein